MISVITAAEQNLRVFKTATKNSEGTLPFYFEITSNKALFVLMIGTEKALACCLEVDADVKDLSTDKISFQIEDKTEIAKFLAALGVVNKDDKLLFQIDVDTGKMRLSLGEVTSGVVPVCVNTTTLHHASEFTKEAKEYEVFCHPENLALTMYKSQNAKSYYIYWELKTPGSVTELYAGRAVTEGETNIPSKGKTFLDKLTDISSAGAETKPDAAVAKVDPVAASVGVARRRVAAPLAPPAQDLPTTPVTAVTPPVTAPVTAPVTTTVTTTVTATVAPPVVAVPTVTARVPAAGSPAESVAGPTASTPPPPNTDPAKEPKRRLSQEERRAEKVKEAMAVLAAEAASESFRSMIEGFVDEMAARYGKIIVLPENTETETFVDAINTALFRLDSVRDKLISAKAKTPAQVDIVGIQQEAVAAFKAKLLASI